MTPRVVEVRNLSFSYPQTPVLENVDGSVSVHLTASVEYSEGMSTYTLPTSPILVSFTAVPRMISAASARRSPAAAAKRRSAEGRPHDARRGCGRPPRRR